MCSTSRWPTSPSSARASSPLAGTSSPRASSPSSPSNATSGGRGWARCHLHLRGLSDIRVPPSLASSRGPLAVRLTFRAADAEGRPLGRPLELQRGVGSVELLKSQPLWGNMPVTVELAPQAVTVRLRLSVCPSHASSATETAETVLGKAELLRRALPVCAEGDASLSLGGATLRLGVLLDDCELLRRRGDDALHDVAALERELLLEHVGASQLAARLASTQGELGVARRQLLSQRTMSGGALKAEAGARAQLELAVTREIGRLADAVAAAQANARRRLGRRLAAGEHRTAAGEADAAAAAAAAAAKEEVASEVEEAEAAAAAAEAAEASALVGAGERGAADGFGAADGWRAAARDARRRLLRAVVGAAHAAAAHEAAALDATAARAAEASRHAARTHKAALSTERGRNAVLEEQMLSLAVENGSGALAMQRVCGATDAQLAALVSQLHALAGSSETLVGRVDGWIAHKASVDGPAAAAAAQRDALAAQLEVANAANARLDAELARARQAAALHAAVANRVSAEAQAREASGRRHDEFLRGVRDVFHQATPPADPVWAYVAKHDARSPQLTALADAVDPAWRSLATPGVAPSPGVSTPPRVAG
jgi:hypothetical protein